MLGLPGLVDRSRGTAFAGRAVPRVREHTSRLPDRVRTGILRGQRREGFREAVIAARGHRRHVSIGERQPRRKEQSDQLA